MTDDLISRQAVLEQIKGWLGYELKDMTNPIYYLEKRIKAMPSVTPTERTGHWIDMTSGYAFNDKCSKCGYIVNIQFIDEYKYCPNCGCRMVEPQESEDKE